VNGQPATVSFLGLAPGWTGLVQADFQIPTDLPAPVILPSAGYSVVVIVNGESSLPASILVD
jgi:uncharacterized protein (TIGR03437 family)